MYEEIRRPYLLKYIPLLLIRGLSPLYYFCRYSQQTVPDRVNQIFESHIDYLTSALQVFGKESADNSLLAISEKFAELKMTPAEDRQDNLEKTTVALSEKCKDIETDLQKTYKAIRLKLIDLYKDKTKKIKVLVVNNDNDSERLDKIVSLLQNFCYYSTDKINYPSPQYAEKMVATEFAFFLSTHPSGIHELVKSLNTYHIPGLAIAYIERNGKTDEQAIRHGAQLQRAGFYVLYKIFTPIRLFTSIDKIYMKYYLAESR